MVRPSTSALHGRDARTHALMTGDSALRRNQINACWDKTLKKPRVQVYMVAMAATAHGEVLSWGAGLSCRRSCLTQCHPGELQRDLTALKGTWNLCVCKNYIDEEIWSWIFICSETNIYNTVKTPILFHVYYVQIPTTNKTFKCVIKLFAGTLWIWTGP